MLFGIKYDVNRKGLRNAGESMQKFGGAIIPHGKCDLFFTSRFQAWLTAKELTKSHENVTYSVYIYNPIFDKEITENDIVKTKEEYFQKQHEKTEKLLEELKSRTKDEPQK